MSLFVSRRQILRGLAASTFVSVVPRANALYFDWQKPNGPIKITDVEVFEVRGAYTTPGGVNGQQQVNPLDVYDDLRPPVYADKPTGKDRTVKMSAMYLRIKTDQGLEGLYGPIEEDAAVIVYRDLRKFLIGKDPLAGELLWDEMYRSNRQSRASIYMMAISACDICLWDLRGRYFGVPVYRLLGGPTRNSVEFYASCLGFSLEPEAVRTRAAALKKEGWRNMKWFMAYGPGSGPEGMRKNVELVKVLRETVGDDVEIMFDCYSGWDMSYALEWARQVEQYRPRWVEEITMPNKIESFAQVRRKINFPVASGEHFYTRWDVERYLEAQAIDVVQADPEWCGGVSELVKIGTLAALHDVPVMPHGHCLHAALHVIASQPPMTFPLGEYLVNKMAHFYMFEKNPLFPKRAHLELPMGPGFNIELDPTKIEAQRKMEWE